MAHEIDIWALVAFIENRAAEEITYEILEEQLGFSYHYIREFFRQKMGEPLARYIVRRKVAHAAFDLIYTAETVLSIGMKYFFSNPDTFTKAFKRYTGVTPRQFRREKRRTANKKLCVGVYGVDIVEQRSERNMENKSDGTVLYGVPKVGYGVYESCTPFIICMKAIAEYLGEQQDFSYMFAASGAAFRLTWNEGKWDVGNVDVCYTFKEEEKIYRVAAEALGREFRTSFADCTSKEETAAFIRENIDRGYPCMVRGIIGPAEICIITGYQEEGEILLGWSFFQDVPELIEGIAFEESGYFKCRNWWENMEYKSIYVMERKTKAEACKEEITARAVEVLRGRTEGGYKKGIAAYDGWKNDILREEYFSNQTLPHLAEILICHGDAMDCLADGRYRAAEYFEGLAGKEENRGLPYGKIASCFRKVTESIAAMNDILEDSMRGEKAMRNIGNRQKRVQLAALIDQAQAADKERWNIWETCNSDQENAGDYIVILQCNIVHEMNAIKNPCNKRE